MKPDELARDIAQKYGDGNWSFELREAICDAILAATAEEREACAAVADAEKLTGMPPANFTQDEVMLANVAVRVTAQSIAAAIRKRGGGIDDKTPSDKHSGRLERIQG